ncbi:hypothetical protein Pfo_008330 [Paulownia fortunei]|nr:hypothetical protein Pfo_008330 [Paulownia fortunei]
MKMSTIHFMLFIAILAVVSLLADAYDPDPLQDFCVAVNDSKAAVFVNGKICKDPKTVTADDFSFSGLNKAGNISSPVGSKVTMVFVDELAGLNTLGISLVRIDYALNGLNPPHEHPRASEILVVLKGMLYAGFITSNPQNPNEKNKLFAKILYPGDVFVFPKGLIHFQYNVGNNSAIAIASLNSQNPGVVTLAKAVFGSEPPVSPVVLAKAFQVDKKVVDYLQSLPWMGNNYPLQYFCVEVNDSKASVFVNGKICKDSKRVTADDFFFSGIKKPGNTSNPLGSKVTPVTVNQLAGLNTLGISLILAVVQGTLYVGFVTSNPANPNQKNKLFTKVLYPGDVFVFPEGLFHFQFNTGETNAVAFAGLSGQNPGVITIANAVFGSNPPISSDVLTKAFQVDKNVIKYLQGQFW